MRRFENIDINREVILQSELNIANKTRSNYFSWNGQFSPQFIETLLRNFANDSDIIIDPFAGSGTTLCEAARKGIKAYGIELNVSAYYMSKTYELANLNGNERHILIKDTEKVIESTSSTKDILPLLLQTIGEYSGKKMSDLLSTLVVLLDLYNNELTKDYLEKKWKELKKIVLEIPYTSASIKADLGDARKLNCENDTASLLVTSPPYINVFNYHQKYRRSVEALGFDVLKIARKEIGANRKNRGNRFLTVIQYCIDMALSLREAIRVCREDSRMIYIVGRESHVLGYSFCNSQLIYEIATEIFNMNFLLRQERVFKNRYGQLIYEDILHFQNNKSYTFLKDEEIEKEARAIATDMLKEKVKLESNSKNMNLLYEAIEKSDTVKKSED